MLDCLSTANECNSTLCIQNTTTFIEDNSNTNSELSLLPILEEMVNLIRSLKPTVEMSYYFELYREKMISKAMDYILTEKYGILAAAPGWKEYNIAFDMIKRRDYGNELVMEKLVRVLNKTEETIQILKDLGLKELAWYLNHALSKNKMNAQCKKDSEQDTDTASSASALEVLKKHEMEYRNAPDQKSSNKLIINYVWIGIFPNIKFVHPDYLHYSVTMEGMTREEKTGHLD